MKKIILFFTSLLFSFSASAQNEGRNVITGSVTDANGNALANATVAVNSNGKVVGATADDKGIFSVEYPAGGDSIDIECSLVGYETKKRKIKSEGSIKLNITLNEKSVALNGVTVDGKTQIVKDDHLVFIPTKRQVNGSNTGISLLFNLMLPQLNVDRITGTVKGIDGTDVTFYIDGRKASSSEINQLRPKDVVKVEYYDHATEKFPGGSGKILNYIVKKYEYGGYINMYANTQWLYSTGAYSIQTKINHKKADYMVLAGTGFSKYTGWKESETATYNLDQPFTRLTAPGEGRYKTINHYGLFRSSATLGKTFLFAQAGLNWSESPYGRTTSTVSYSPSLYPTVASFQNTYSKSISPNGKVYFNTRLNEKTSLDGTLTYKYGRNRYRRNYEEGTEFEPILNNTHEDRHELDMDLTYNMYINKKSSLSLFLWGNYNSSDVNYSGTTEDNQTMTTFNLIFLPTYSYDISKKVRLMARPGIYMKEYEVNDRKYATKVYPNLYTTLSYSINQISNLSFSASMAINEPMLYYINTADLEVNGYEIKRGNPDLDIMKLYNAGIHYNFMPEKLPSGSLYLTYSGCGNVIKDIYFPENGSMVHTYTNDGDYHNISVGLGLSKPLFNRALYLRGNVSYEYTKVNGLYTSDFDWVGYNLSAVYYLKKFTFSGNFSSDRKVIGFASDLSYMHCSYGFMASWNNHKGLYIEAGCRNIFENTPRRMHSADYGAYSCKTFTWSDDMGKRVYVTLSYNFDFGRKVRFENVRTERNSESAIMKP